MAELAERDRRIILGDNYKEIEEAAQKASGVKDTVRLRAAAMERADSQRINSLAFVVVGALLLISNYFAVSGPSAWPVALFGGALCALGAGLFWRQTLTLGRLAAEARAEVA